ncbi:MAG: signal recognition particle-docking protein FtsY [Bdellovibrionales bacterium RIFOXYD12_FULL_39_22]|nr:MAG: signal recognition particle-docking protein FtsY [Bdellovibrionales bacterium RIFOXYB1_FULL_39_21]OFZ45315.1 MAG: signal recognition particle-docking protein FtsY [Bdellovibrionales bacterium RIFOXYC12_FULL_39_17]OFZ45692.1 MAG: signal recognition particle-docking protein FtsY [Bdellovibrionales bacterium RIFOXYC1_FULL_39_130]OFZ72110.1 MAG: signal recognition particle-docking protein FtsY [Bdellovibrionales bacterium RIFOXYC2_FULL_39_8]OFZ77554.1 MAG: signal recognition particle-dockin
MPEVSWTDRLKRGLTQTRSEIWGKIGQLLTLSSVNKAELEQIEELLYSSDIGPKLVNELLEKIKSAAPVSGGNIDFKQLLASFIREKMEKIQSTVTTKSPEQKSGFPHSIMVVGVNGAGKTTTIGKLATKFTKEGARVIVGACDTFRAAAVDQLQVWCERAGAEMVRASGSSRPSGVAYEALQKAINGQADYCILDTAGRLHTEENLMEELKKTKNVLAKLDPKAPNEVWLVLDAITGQNAIRQAIEFNNTLKLTGLIFTKCDSSSKAGGAIAIVEQLAVPIVYIGVGESVEDINSFNLNDYISALLG